MSLQRLAMLTAISYHNLHNNGNNNAVKNSSQSAMTPAVATTTSSTIATSLLLSSTTMPTKLMNSNKSTLIQLNQQQQTEIVLPTTFTSVAVTAATTPRLTKAAAQKTAKTSSSSSSSATSFSATYSPTSTSIPTFNTTTTTVTKLGVLASPPLNPYNNKDQFESHGDQHQQKPHRHHTTSSSSSSSGNIYTDSEDEDATDSGGVSDEMTGRQRPVNTFYGSGFGIFHQQRSNMGGAGGGGGIALITGNSGSGLGSGSYSNGINNNVNLLLGGAMLTLITTILCVVCYCCHRNIKKRTEAAYRQQRQWLENDPNMEIYSVEQCYETSGLFVGDSMDGLATIPALHHEPPPSYDAVVAMQEQQQLLLQQQQQHLLMQQLQNNSPPPGYRSSLDVSCMLTARAAALTPAILAMGSNDTNNSLAASTSTNIGAANSRMPNDGNDLNGNRDMMGATTSATSASNHMQQQQQLQQPNYLRAAKQRQRNLATANMANFNMKKVLQAQSCCSLQRAEVENMWNAAAAALAARSNHVNNEARGTASTSSPTLVMNNRKLSNAQSSKANTPETFGSRYLKQQNYYRRGCPMCGKFRYDNESTLSLSIESDLDNVTIDVAGTNEIEDNSRAGASNIDENRNVEQDLEDDECSCLNTNHKQLKQQKARRNLTANALVTNNLSGSNSNNNLNDQNSNVLQENIELSTNCDLNANRAATTTTAAAAMTGSATATSNLSNNNNNNNNNNDDNDEEASCSTSLVKPTTAAATAATSSPATSNSITIDLDCINENGIISLDMSKIIDKTGLPTYDAALKLESSGYV